MTGFGQMMQAYIINMRRPLFQDIRVREALVYSYDFENTFKTGLYQRADSLFNNSDFAAQGIAGAGRARAARAVPQVAAAPASSARPSAPRAPRTRPTGCAATC